MLPNKEHGTTVELNAAIIGFLLGEEESVVEAQIARMCEPDPKSRTRDREGRKLVRLSEYTFLVVNGDYYRSIRNEEQRREYQRVKQAQYRREKKKGKKGRKPRTPWLGDVPKDQQSEERMQRDLGRLEDKNGNGHE